MGCVSGLVNTIVFIFNFLCALVGLVLIIVGSIFYAAIEEYHELTQNNLKVAPVLVIAVGVIVFIISFLGCCGVTQRSRCMLFSYATILLILFIIQIVAGIYGYVQVENNGGDLKKEIDKAVKETFEHYDETGSKQLFDTVQLQLGCCGVDGPADYPISHRDIPASCCGNSDDKESCSTSSAYSTGCSSKLYSFIKDSVKLVANVAFGIAAVELIGALFAIYLGSRIDNY